MEQYMKNYLRWLESDQLSESEKAELHSIRDDDGEIRLRFTSYLSFGTAGLRGIMKTGMNAMNVHTVAYATQGLANLILKQGRAADGVAIAYDSRNNSALFAKTSAQVLAAAGIKSYLFDDLRPTPELSFALREYGCVAGINITASHNPKQYNGYKAYWEDGAQLPPEHADTVSAEMEALDIFADVKLADFDKALADGMIIMLGAETDQKYLAQVVAQAVNPDAVKAVADDLKIVYTPLHGTGHLLVPEVMKRIGLKHLYTVPEQMIIDGNFPTVPKPNPEYPQVFELGIAIANEVGSDLIVATDPDADRVGVMTRTADGSFMTITGNQMGALLLDYILTAYEQTGSMPDHPYAVKTIVSTELAAAICAAHNVKMHNVLTGFKFIGEVIKNYEAKGYGSFILGFEESYGYLKGTYARDKDAVVASMLICEMTAYYKAKNMTLGDALNGLYARYGYCYETNVEIYMEGLDGDARMAAMMDALRNDPPALFGDVPVELFGDYKTETFTELATGKKIPTGLPKSNVLYFKLTNGDVIVVRPSGTEPKIKFYFLLLGKDKDEVLAKLEGYKKTLEA
ncbi:MAG: phospho-sugar mutase [Ruminococcaceae bacterium]|nr:phospho-sugar mutase [Oscillospiraceae bacterium]